MLSFFMSSDPVSEPAEDIVPRGQVPCSGRLQYVRGNSPSHLRGGRTKKGRWQKKNWIGGDSHFDDDNERPRGSASGDKESRHVLIQSSDWASHRSNHIFRVVERRGPP